MAGSLSGSLLSCLQLGLVNVHSILLETIWTQECGHLLLLVSQNRSHKLEKGKVFHWWLY